MITAVDTNVLLDLLVPDAPHGDRSESALAVALDDGQALISDLVYAELAARFPSPDALERFLAEAGIERQSLTSQALFMGGRAWGTYLDRRPNSLVCASCGASNPLVCRNCDTQIAPRQHVVADFLIGAQAFVQSDRLLTRDRGFYRRYFAGLQLLEW